MSADGFTILHDEADQWGGAGEPRNALDRLMPIRFGREICGELAAAERREWWIGNGRGAYAAGTLALSLTRRYHGLLIAPVDPPLGRVLVLAKADAELVVGQKRHSLFTNHWASGAITPEGHLAIESFHLDGSIPVWRFAIGAHRIEQRIWMEPGRQRLMSRGASRRGATARHHVFPSRCSRTAATIMARRGYPGSYPRSPPTAKRSRCGWRIASCCACRSPTAV